MDCSAEKESDRDYSQQVVYRSRSHWSCSMSDVKGVVYSSTGTVRTLVTTVTRVRTVQYTVVYSGKMKVVEFPRGEGILLYMYLCVEILEDGFV